MLEIGLMLDCTTFLGWGISEVNDVVENQRMRMKKSYCKSNEHLVEEIVFPTWYNSHHSHCIIIIMIIIIYRCANRNKTLYSPNFSDALIATSHQHANTNINNHINHHYDKINNHSIGAKTQLRERLQNITLARVHHHHQQQHDQNNNEKTTLKGL